MPGRAWTGARRPARPLGLDIARARRPPRALPPRALPPRPRDPVATPSLRADCPPPGCARAETSGGPAAAPGAAERPRERKGCSSHCTEGYTEPAAGKAEGFAATGRGSVSAGEPLPLSLLTGHRQGTGGVTACFPQCAPSSSALHTLSDPAGEWALLDGDSSGSAAYRMPGLVPRNCWPKEGAGQASTSSSLSGAAGDLRRWIKSVLEGTGLQSCLGLALNLFLANSGAVPRGDPGLGDGRGRWKEGLMPGSCGQGLGLLRTAWGRSCPHRRQQLLQLLESAGWHC